MLGHHGKTAVCTPMPRSDQPFSFRPNSFPLYCVSGAAVPDSLGLRGSENPWQVRPLGGVEQKAEASDVHNLCEIDFLPPLGSRKIPAPSIKPQYTHGWHTNI